MNELAPWVPRGAVAAYDGNQAGRQAEALIRRRRAPATEAAYRSAIRYWRAWARLRFGIEDLQTPVDPRLVIQFALDHCPVPVTDEDRRKAETEPYRCTLPEAVDAALVKEGAKGKPGAFTLPTIEHRISMLSTWHKDERRALGLTIEQHPDPCATEIIKDLRKSLRNLAANEHEPRQRTPILLSELELLLATCPIDGDLADIRDRAILLIGFNTGGRRRSELSAMKFSQLARRDGGWFWRLGKTKTNQTGSRKNPDKPIRGLAADALSAWLAASKIDSGYVFRHLSGRHKGKPLSGHAINAMIRSRAHAAGLDPHGSWGGHSLRTGFVVAATNSGASLDSIMKMTDHADTKMLVRYQQTAELAKSPVSDLASGLPSGRVG